MKRKNLKKFRIDLDLKSKEMSKKLGVNPTYYSNIENGRVNPNFEFMERFEKTFKNQYEDIWFLFKKE